MENNYKDIKDCAMKVLWNIGISKYKGGIGKSKFESNVPRHVINFLESNNLISFEKVGGKLIDNQVVLATEKGEEELKEYFKYK